MFRVAVVNSKGGSGKTTLATNIASYYASKSLKTCIIDHDPQGSASFWANSRPESSIKIQTISAFKQTSMTTRSWFLRPEANTERVVIDTPSGLDVLQFKSTLDQADAILIPVLPSSIDIHAVTHFIADLLLQGKVKRQQGRIAVLANRARTNTLVYRQLENFLGSLGIPFIATLRDTHDYIKATERGIGLFEAENVKKKDLDSWQPILSWLDNSEQQQLAHMA